MSKRIFNFSAGPAVLPEPVLIEAQKDLVNYKNCGMSVMEMSHRSKEFDEIILSAESGLREVMGIPENYAVLFLQGGASLQFAMIPYNLYIKGKPVDVLNTGVWTKKAINELKKLTEYRIAASTEDEGFRRVPRQDEIKINADASYVHMASNNTIYGTEYRTFPDTGDIPLVCDMSSDILSRPVDVSKFGLIFAGAQKNIGPSGVVIVIIRKDLADRCDKKLPTMLQYRTFIEERSLYNTPPTFSIYIISLVMNWLKSIGGVKAIEKINQNKAGLLYEAIDASNYYYCPVKKDSRSSMNVIFRINGDREDLEQKFVKEAKSVGLSGLKGHRLTGGLRASIYNAHPVEGVKALISFMEKFQKENK